jgi:hypothetical protein
MEFSKAPSPSKQSTGSRLDLLHFMEWKHTKRAVREVERRTGWVCQLAKLTPEKGYRYASKYITQYRIIL